MKLYEQKNQNGRTVEWWTQRNSAGNYFSIIPGTYGKFAGKFLVMVNKDSEHRKLFAVQDTFLDAEKYLRMAEQKYS